VTGRFANATAALGLTGIGAGGVPSVADRRREKRCLCREHRSLPAASPLRFAPAGGTRPA